MNDLAMDLGSRYRVLGTLGEGGMGTVFRVEDTTSGREVALKVLSRQAGDDGQPAPMSERDFLQFKQEFRTMGRLRHPHTCEVYDYGLLPDGSPYFTMEVVPGRGLDELIPLAIGDFAAILRQIGLALGFIHQQGFVHCDLKPENIRVTPDGHVKLMDFGLMEVAGQALEAVKGTLAYVAPEVAKLERIDQRSDIYALGAVAYHLLAGQPPFQGNSALELMRAHVSQVPVSLGEHRPEVPPLVREVVAKMLAKEPVARYQSAADVLAALGIEVDDEAGVNLLACPLIGAQAELERLGVALAMLGTGQGQALAFVGADGCGKSRLVGEFRFMAQLDERPVLVGTCSEPPAPYGPFVAVLRGLVPLARVHAPDYLAENAPLLAKLVPELADGRPAPVLEPTAEKILIQSTLTGLLTRALAPTGGVLAFEDWDLADPLSAETLTYVLRNMGLEDNARLRAPVVVLVTARTRDAVAAVPDAGVGTLSPLGVAETSQMAKSMLGVDDVPAGLAAQILEISRGNPMLIGSLLEHLVRAGILAKVRGKWVLPETLPPEALPHDVTTLLLDRLADLTLPARGVAEFAALYGAPVALADMRALLPDLAEEDLFDALDELLQARIMDAVEQQGTAYRFTSSALRHSLYATLDPARQQAEHTRVAAYLEGRLGGADEAPLSALTQLARHHLRGTDASRAVHFALLAGERNLGVLAHEAARDLLEQGLALLRGLADLAQRDGTMCDYLNALSTTHHWKHELAPAALYLAEALPIADRLGDKARLLELLVTQAKNCSLTAGVGKTKEAIATLERAIAIADEIGLASTGVRARVNLGRNLFFQGSHSRAREVFEQALAVANAAELPIWQGACLSFLGYLLVLAGPTTREVGFANMAEAIALQERVGDLGGVGYTYNLLFELQLQAGKFVEAEASAVRNAEIARELGITDDHVIALLNQAIVCQEMGALDRATSVGERCQLLANQYGHQTAQVIAKAVLALVAVLRGRLAEGALMVDAAESTARETNSYINSIVSPYVIECHLGLGRLQDALNAAQEAQFLLRSLENQEGQMRLWGYLAEIHGRLGQLDMAKDFAKKGFDAAVDLDAKGAVVRSLRIKAWLARQEGHLDEASRFAEQGLSLASNLGSALLTTQLSGLMGEISLSQGLPEAMQHFQAMQALADQMGAPQFRAHALFGQAAANPSADSASAMLVESQKILRSLAADAGEVLGPGFLAEPGNARILEKIPGIAEPVAATPEDSQLTLERLQRVSSELQNVAGQYGLLFKEWTSKSAQLEMLNNLAKKINETLVIDAVLVQVVQLTLQITKAERGFLFLADEENGGQLTCKSAFNQFGRPIAHERSSMSLCMKVAANGKSIAIMDAMADSEFQASKSIAALNLRTLMCVPLHVKGQTIGVLYVDSQAVVTTFTQKDLELLEAIASHAAVAIENATLYTALNRRAAELERALELYRKADYEASTDMLTGLRNRRFFADQASRELDISRRYARQLSVILLDVDHFKRFNDTYGHAIGDEVLKGMGAVLTHSVRTCDLPARFGGEEFVVLCPDTDVAGARLVAERIRAAVAEVRLNDLEGNPVRQITASLGVAAVQPGDRDLAALIEKADAALYHAKATGRNVVVPWSESLSEDGA